MIFFSAKWKIFYEIRKIKQQNPPFHYDHETFLIFVGVLKHISDVDNVFAPAGSPMKINFPSALHVVFQNFESALLLGLDVAAGDDLAADPQPQHVPRAEI